MGKQKQGSNYVEEITKMEQDFSQWYTDVVLKAELADYGMVKGCMAIKPYGFQIWEQIRAGLNERLMATGHQNVYLPILIPESLLNKEKEHVEGFAPEVAWVTIGGEKELEERLCIRPTSETLFSTMFAKWVNSWRDLPLLYNQWGNVVRWEKSTRPFLRTAEFLWQEGHTVHATAEESAAETQKILKLYSDYAEKVLAIPVIKGRKTEQEKFAGAVNTYTIEAMMHDGQALQAGTSHNFGQNFSIPFEIKYQNKAGKMEYCWQTSWGVTTRLIGGIIMVHGDNRGLVLPPRVAPVQVILVPIAGHKTGVLKKCQEVLQELRNLYRVIIDDRDNYSPGWKFNQWEMKGVPLRLEIGPRDIIHEQVVLVRRDTGEKEVVKIEQLKEQIGSKLADIQNSLFQKALEKREKRTYRAEQLKDFKKIIAKETGFIKGMLCGNKECEEKMKEITRTTVRCIPFEQEKLSERCICCGGAAGEMAIFARAY